MNEMLSFFKEIFMISNDSSRVKIGLSQFKNETVEKTKKKPEKISKDIKISDLMRRSA